LSIRFTGKTPACASSRSFQYFTLLHEFQQIPLESHRMLEFHLDSTRMVGISNSCGFQENSYGFPVEFEWNA